MRVVKVFEYLESDLEAVIRDPSLILSASDIKSYIQMCLESLAFIHAQGVFHRDVKPNNLLISKTGSHQVMLMLFKVERGRHRQGRSS